MNDSHRRLRQGEIYKFKADNKNLVLDVQRSSFFVAEEITSDILDICDGLVEDDVVNLLKAKYPPNSIAEAIQELREIELVSENQSNSSSYTYPQTLEVTSLDLPLPSNPDLNGRGCGVGENAYSRRKSSDKMLYDAVNFLLKESGQQRECSITFSSNNELSLDCDLLRDIIEYSKQEEKKYNKRINWVLNSNTGSFDAKTVKYLKKNKVNLRLNVNSTRKISHRPKISSDFKEFPNMNSRGIRRLLKSPQVTVEARLKVEEPPFSGDINRLFDLGFGLVSIDSDFWSGVKNGNTDGNNLESIKKEYEKVAKLIPKELRRGRLLGFSGSVALMRRIQTHRRKLYGCGAGRYHFAVSSNGDLYPCSRFLGMEDFWVGNLITGLDRDSQQRFIDNYVDNRELCNKCWARYFCGGGCIYESVIKEGQIRKPFQPSCELFKQNLKLALVTFLKMTEDQKLLLKLFGHIIQAHMSHLNNDFGFLNVKDKINCVKPLGNSMLPLIKDGDKIFIKRSKPTEMKVGDVIAFETPNSITIHRVIGKKFRNGQLFLIEKGDNNLHSNHITEGNIVGKVFAVERSGRIIRLDTKLWRMMGSIIVFSSHFFTNIPREVFMKRRRSKFSLGNLRILHNLILSPPKFGIWALFYFQSWGKESWLKGRYKFRAS